MATGRKVNMIISEQGSECEWWDDGCPECMLPWGHPGNDGCGGNPFACRKFYYRYLASTEKPSQSIIDEFETRTSGNVR